MERHELGGYATVSTTGTYAYNPAMSGAARWADGIVAYKAGSSVGVQQPGVPTGLTVTDNGDGTRTLRWTAPSSSSPAVDFYRVYRDGQNYTDRIDTVGDTQTCPSSTRSAGPTPPPAARRTHTALPRPPSICRIELPRAGERMRRRRGLGWNVSRMSRASPWSSFSLRPRRL